MFAYPRPGLHYMSGWLLKPVCMDTAFPNEIGYWRNVLRICSAMKRIISVVRCTKCTLTKNSIPIQRGASELINKRHANKHLTIIRLLFFLFSSFFFLHSDWLQSLKRNPTSEPLNSLLRLRGSVALRSSPGRETFS